MFSFPSPNSPHILICPCFRLSFSLTNQPTFYLSPSLNILFISFISHLFSQCGTITQLTSFSSILLSHQRCGNWWKVTKWVWMAEWSVEPWLSKSWSETLTSIQHWLLWDCCCWTVATSQSWLSHVSHVVANCPLLAARTNPDESSLKRPKAVHLLAELKGSVRCHIR